MEYTKYQVNISQAKIRDQEATIKDLRFRNNILESRVADLEKKQKDNIYDKYFPSESTSAQPSTRNNTGSCCSATPHILLSCCHNNPTQGAVHTSSTEDVTEKLDDLKRDLDGLKCRFDMVSEVSIHKIIRDLLQNHVIPPGPIPNSAAPVSPATPCPASIPKTTPASNECDNISHTTIDEIDISEDLN